MSVNKKDIDFGKAFDKAADGILPSKPSSPPKNTAKKNAVDAAFDSFDNGELKKKDTPPSEPSGVSLKSKQGGESTTNLTWENNPLNPVKAANDYEDNRDKTPEILFKDSDKEKVNSLLSKHGIAPVNPEYTSPLINTDPSAPVGQQMFQKKTLTPAEIDYQNTVNLETNMKQQLDAMRIARQGQRGMPKTKAEEDLEKDISEIGLLKRKAATELAVSGDKEVVVNQRTDDSGNSYKRTMQDLFGSKPGAWKTEKPQIEDKMKKMPTQFLTGLNMLRLTEPAEYERVQDALNDGLPISSSQTAKITALGLNIEEAKLQRDILKSPVTNEERQKANDISKTLGSIRESIDKYEGMIKSQQQLSPVQVQDYKTKINQYNGLLTQNKALIEKVNTIDGAFAKKAAALQKARLDNLLDNREVLRAFIADGVATKLDELGKMGQVPTSGQKAATDFMLGHTWNYTADQIKWASEQYLKEQGLDPSSKQAQDAIKYLQDNEGVMIGENSIAKAGGFRELGEGLLEPITGISKSLDDLTRPTNDIYAESQSEGNVKVAKKRLASEDTGVRGVVNEVLKGTGQFVSQAAIMYATSGGIGAVAEGIMGKSGVQLLADAKAANIKTVIPFDDATANIAAGKFLYNIKDPLSVFTTSYAMVYDSNLKAALSYTSDNSLAKKAAAFNSAMEGATELFLSPLEIAQGIIHKFSKNQTKDILKILSDKSLKDDPSALKEYVGKFARGVLGTAKVATAEIGEELVTQISDYVTNMYLNPDSDSFKNRDLRKELMQTAYQTGLSMALPALINGIGSARANTFSKGSLMVAAQNRQAMIDAMNRDVAAGKLSQDEANKQIQLINTAAEVNATLPKKVNGDQLNSNEKANYIWSRVTEAYMDNQKTFSKDAAQKEIWDNKILEQQEYRKKILGIKEEEETKPEYTIDEKPVTKEELLKTAEEKPDEHTYTATGDEEVQQKLRDIGGVDEGIANKKAEQTPLEKAQEIVANIDSDNYSIAPLKEAAENDPEQFKEFLSEIAQQAHDERSNPATVKIYGKELVDIAQAMFPPEQKTPEGKPLSKLEALKAKKLLAKEEVPGESIDEKLLHISQQPENFSSDLVTLANKRFPAEVAKDSGLTSVDQKEVERQMAPITDKMAEIEQKFAAAGLNIDWDYDNEVLVTNDEGIVDPEAIPDELKQSAADYEKATQQLADYDQKAYNKSLKKSRKRIQGEEAEFTEVKPKEVKEPSTVSDYESKKADIERRRQEELNQKHNAGYSTIALDYLFTGGRNIILSTDYLLQALVGGFNYAATEINDIRNKYADKLGNIKDDINSDVYNQMMNEIRDVINKKYDSSKANEIFDKILKNATGFVAREGNQVNSELDRLNEQIESKINAKYDAELEALNNKETSDINDTIEQQKADIERRRQEAKENPVPEPISYKEAVEEYKSTELGSSENAKVKKQKLVDEASTPEGKKFVENQVTQMETNEDGTITVYRSGTMQEGHNPATTSKQTAEIIANERKQQGLSSDIIEVKVNPSDISVVVPGIESEIFIKVDNSNKERIDNNTKKKQKTKQQLLSEKDNVKNELEKTKNLLENAKEDKANGTFKFSDNVYKDIVKKQELKIKNLEWQLTKYDAELQALEAQVDTQQEQKAEQPVKTQQEQQSIEAKKADIERRRQEELKQVKSLEQTPEQLIRNTKIAEQRLRDAEEIFSFGNTYSDALDNIMLKQKKLNEILRKREKEETKNRDFHQWEKEELEKQPEYQENKRLDKIIALINEVYTEGKSENFNNSTKEAVDYEQNELNNVSSKKYRNTEEIRKINAKYDAELAALDQSQTTIPTTNTTEIQTQQKADIERRRQEQPKIKDVNLNKQIDLLSADFLDINKPEIAPSSQRIKIVDVPLSSISTDTESFQNRETEYSQESVDKILKAVEDGRFNWTEFDPITLWKNEGKLYVLSGHSRFEAFKRLAAAGNSEFETIPAEIFEGSKDDAIAIALRSNTLSTKETPIERANFYRDARLKGTSSRAILNEAKEYEGRNAPTIIALSYLNPSGKAISDLKALGQEGDTKSKANSLQMARWVGEVRQQFPQITNEHENEIYDWLKGGAYSKIKNIAEISSRINNVVSGFDFDSDKPLNLEHRATKSYVDEQYEQQLADKEKEIKAQQKVISDKAAKYNEANLTPQEVAEKLVPDNAILSRLQQDYIKLKEKKGTITQANRGILSLFDNIQIEINNGTLTEEQATDFINNTGEVEERDAIIEDIERNAESPDTAATALEEANELLRGEDVNANRNLKAENKLADRVAELEKEKRVRLNEITKPVVDIPALVINDLFTLASTTEANRQEYNDIKDQFYGLKNLIDCLYS